MRSRRLQKFVWPLLALASLLTLFAPESESHAGAFIDPQSTFGEILIPAKRWGANDGADVYSNVDPVTLKPTPWNKYDRMEFGRIYQCMELVTRFFHLQFGHTKSWNVLLAKDTFENHPPGIEAYANGDSASAGPNWGDILVFDASRTYPDGHVAIVYARSRDRVYFVEQNISLDDGTVIGHDSLAIGKDNRIDNKSGLFVQNRPTVKGWLHSTSNSGGQSLDIKPMVPGGVWASPLETVSTTDAAL
ncbi:MAG: CHAP domain-containing protein, partial [Thermomicrobiales bacterium]